MKVLRTVIQSLDPGPHSELSRRHFPFRRPGISEQARAHTIFMSLLSQRRDIVRSHSHCAYQLGAGQIVLGTGREAQAGHCAQADKCLL